jgi:hypothetical protein
MESLRQQLQSQIDALLSKPRVSNVDVLYDSEVALEVLPRGNPIATGMSCLHVISTI